MKSIDKAIDFCAEFDPDFPELLEGCAEEDIDDLREELGRPLFPEHLRFLERMGEKKGWLDFGRGDMSAWAVESSLGRTDGAMPENLCLIGLGEEDPAIDMFLRQVEDSEPAVVFNQSVNGFDWSLLDSKKFRPGADSLAQLICVRALLDRFLEIAPIRRQLKLERHESEFLTEVDEFFSQLGLEPLWFSGPTTRVARRKSIRIMARQYPGIAGMIFIAAEIEDGEEYAEVLLGTERYIERHEPPSGEPNLS